jgi:hypothetical protein
VKGQLQGILGRFYRARRGRGASAGVEMAINGHRGRPVLMAIMGWGLDGEETVGGSDRFYCALKERIEGREAQETQGGGWRARSDAVQGREAGGRGWR